MGNPGYDGRRRVAFAALAASALALLAGGCSTDRVTVTEFPRDPVVLVDQDGLETDISYAVYELGMEVDRFEFGLGVDAIQPLIQPRLVGPGHPAFPPPDATFLVVGTEIDGDARAYGMFDIRRNEVVDEVIGGAHVAVTY